MIPKGGDEGYVEVPVQRVEEAVPGAQICISVGASGRTVIYGFAERVRLEWLRPEDESWFALLPTVAHRFSLGRANLLGSLLLPFVGLLVIGASAVAIRVCLREVGS
jgi:hypothetical protein